MWHTMCGILWNVFAAMIFTMTFFTIHAERIFFINYDGYSWGLLELQFFFGGEIMLVSQWIFIFGVFSSGIWYYSVCDIGVLAYVEWRDEIYSFVGICNNFYGVTDQLEKYNLLALWCYESSLYGHFRLKFKLDESFGTYTIWDVY